MMRRVLLLTTSAALLCLSPTAIAQTSQPDQSTTTIVGCLVHGNPPQSANDFFVRTPTVALPVGATVAVGKPGTTSTSTSSGAPAPDSYYRVQGYDREKLRAHLGHKVEVQGHLIPVRPDAAASGVTQTKTTVDANGKPTVTVEKRVDVAGNLHTMNVKMVTASCP